MIAAAIIVGLVACALAGYALEATRDRRLDPKTVEKLERWHEAYNAAILEGQDEPAACRTADLSGIGLTGDPGLEKIEGGWKWTAEAAKTLGPPNPHPNVVEAVKQMRAQERGYVVTPADWQVEMLAPRDDLQVQMDRLRDLFVTGVLSERDYRRQVEIHLDRMAVGVPVVKTPLHYDWPPAPQDTEFTKRLRGE